MKKLYNFITKHLLTFVFAVTAAMLAGVVCYAAYTNLSSVKRVVSTHGGKGTAFSSNYLILVTGETENYELKNISFSENAENASFEINVCNYVLNNPSEVNDLNIGYNLTLNLVNTDGSANTGSYAGLTVQDKNGSYSFTNGVCTISGKTLIGKTKSVDTYRITVPKEFINKINIRAVAEPADEASSSAVNGYKLAREFTFSQYNASATTWTGGFAETTAEGYDGFNYVVKGLGKGTVTLCWDSAVLEISNVFIELNGLQGSLTKDNETGKYTLTFDVDSDVRKRHDIQFYKTSEPDYEQLPQVEFSFTADNQTA